MFIFSEHKGYPGKTVDYVWFIFLFLFLLFNSCRKNSLPVKIFDDRCRIKKIIINDKKVRILYFNWRNDTLISVDEKVEGHKKNKSFRFIYSDGQLIKILNMPIFSATTYHYDENKLLQLITGYTGNLQHVFSYSNKSNIIEQVTFFNKRKYQVINYYYHKGIPVACTVLYPGLSQKKRMSFEYDSVLNPFAGLGSVINIFEPLYGYVPANFPLLLSRIVISSSDKEQKKWTVSDTINISYHCSRKGYPDMINNEFLIEYDCWDSKARWLNGPVNFDPGWESHD